MSIQSIIVSGSSGTIVDIECHLSNNLPNIIIVGFANRAVDEARERIRGAFATSHIMLPRKRVIINLAPADIPKDDSGFDLAIAMAILQANGQLGTTLGKHQAFIGELGLDGHTRAVRGIIGKILIGRARGITDFFIPAANLAQAQLIPKVNLIPVASLEQLYNYLALNIPIRHIKTGAGRYAHSGPPKPLPLLTQIVGQEQAKRALEIAAAGGHNLFFNGPPGTGKSMLAKALASLLPPLTREEMLEVTHVHSLAGHNYDSLVTLRPFRAPHHTASHAAVVGGGNPIKPGEISLAHRGVLFFDELPEFGRETLEALRQPLEDRVIRLARANQRADFPANFMFIATANPCPCGYWGTPRGCACGNAELNSYRNRLSGPLMDRLDLYCDIRGVAHDRLLTENADPQEDEVARGRVTAARQLQAKRYGSSGRLNADMTAADITELAALDSKARKLLNISAAHQQLSARAYMRAIKVSRTIADLEMAATITASHISEALSFRPQPYAKEEP